MVALVVDYGLIFSHHQQKTRSKEVTTENEMKWVYFNQSSHDSIHSMIVNIVKQSLNYCVFSWKNHSCIGRSVQILVLFCFGLFVEISYVYNMMIMSYQEKNLLKTQ